MAVSGSNNRNAKILLFIITVIWGLNTPVIKIGLMYLPPAVYNASRMILAAVFALFVMFITKSYKPMPLSDMKRLAVIGTLGFFVNQLLVIFGMTHTTAGNASLVLATLPVEVALINRIFNAARISRRMLAGIVLGFLGVGLVVVGSNRELSLLGPHLLGALLILIGQSCYGGFTVFIREINERYSAKQIFAYVMILNAGLFSSVALLDIGQVDWTGLPATVTYSIVFSAAFGLVMSNTVWIWVIGKLGCTEAAVSQYLCPVVAICFAWAFMGETLSVLQFCGAAVILSGVYLTMNQSGTEC